MRKTTLYLIGCLFQEPFTTDNLQLKFDSSNSLLRTCTGWTIVIEALPLAQLFSIMILIIKRASEAFSLVMKTNNCLRLRVLTRNMCLHLAYMSSPDEYVFASNRRTCLSMSPSPSFPHSDRGMDRCRYAVPFKAFQ